MRTVANSVANVRIMTSGRRIIPAHSGVLSSASPVLESMLDGPTTRGNRTITILGVPCGAVETFVRFLYSPGYVTQDEMGSYGMHLLVLSHVYRVGSLKRACEAALAGRLTAEVVVDVLQMARQCDAPSLYVRCMKLIAKDFATVEQTEAWGFVQTHDPWLELEILQFLQETDLRQRRRRRKREVQGIYLQLSEAMECLQHICIEGCINIRPHNGEPSNKCKAPCASLRTCESLQFLIRHSVACDKKKVCRRCKRIWQLLRLHSTICDQPDLCKVPLCRYFKLRAEQLEGKEGDYETWKLLAKKVASLRAMSSFAKRKWQESIPRDTDRA